MKYVVTFGKHKHQTKHKFNTKKAAESKAKTLRKNLPGIGFQVKKVK